MTNIQPCPSCVETIVKWLRSEQGKGSDAGVDYADGFADQIEAIWLPKSPAQRLAEECPHGMTPEAAQWVLDREATCKQSLQVQPDAAPRYVFGPWVMYDEHPPKECIEIDVGHAPGTYRRAYRIGQSYTHDGGECPLADGSVVVFAEFNHGVEGNYTASKIHWRNVTSFTPLVQGTGQ